MDELSFIRLEHLFVFELAKHISIKSMVFYLASHIPKSEFYKEVLDISEERNTDDYAVIVESIDFNTLLEDNPDKIMYCGKETGCGIWYDSVQELAEHALVMKLSDVYV